MVLSLTWRCLGSLSTNLTIFECNECSAGGFAGVCSGYIDIFVVK